MCVPYWCYNCISLSVPLWHLLSAVPGSLPHGLWSPNKRWRRLATEDPLRNHNQGHIWRLPWQDMAGEIGAWSEAETQAYTHTHTVTATPSCDNWQPISGPADLRFPGHHGRNWHEYVWLDIFDWVRVMIIWLELFFSCLRTECIKGNFWCWRTCSWYWGILYQLSCLFFLQWDFDAICVKCCTVFFPDFVLYLNIINQSSRLLFHLNFYQAGDYW